jgi:hypothetical protein
MLTETLTVITILEELKHKHINMLKLVVCILLRVLDQVQGVFHPKMVV